MQVMVGQLNRFGKKLDEKRATADKFLESLHHSEIAGRLMFLFMNELINRIHS